MRDIRPQPGAVLSIRDCQTGSAMRLCTDDWRGTFDVAIDRELRHVVLTAAFYQGDVLCGYAADTRDIVTAGQTVSFAPSTIYLSDEFGTFAQPCRLPATTTRIVAVIWTDNDWSSTLTQEFMVSYSLTD